MVPDICLTSGVEIETARPSVSADDATRRISRGDPQPRVTSWHTLQPQTRVYVGCIVALGGVAIVSAISRTPQDKLPLFVVLALLSLITSAVKVNLPVPRSSSTLTVCYVLDYTTLLVLGCDAATLTAAVGAWSQCTFRCRERVPMHQTLFSVAALAVTMQATGLVYAWLGGESGVPRSMAHLDALVAAAMAFFVFNSCLVAGAIALSTQQPLLRVWTANYLWTWPGYLVGFGLATVVAAGIERSGLWLVLFAAISLAITYENFKKYVARLTEAATDPLTDLPNLRSLRADVARELARAARDGSTFGIMLIDVNDFKSFNDTYGHNVGDIALRQIAQCLQQSVRAYDVCARYGGDEFLVLLPGCEADGIRNRAVTLQRAVAALGCTWAAGVTRPLSIGIGSAVFPADGRTFETLLHTADSRMYRDKLTESPAGAPHRFYGMAECRSSQ